MANKSLYFKNLDSIRFIAAMLVFNQHVLSKSFNLLNIESPFLNRFLYLISNGGTGVSIFFVLSGFLITYLIITEIEIKGRLNLGKFYIRRFLRIWPLYFAVIFFWFVIYAGIKSLVGINSPLGSNILYHLTFLSNFDVLTIYQAGKGVDGMFQNINWSVSIEEQFYFIWPIIFLLPKRLWVYLMLLLLAFSIWFRLENAQDVLVNYLHTFSVLVDLVIGGLFAWGVKKMVLLRRLFEKSNTLSHLLLFGLTFFVLMSGTEFILGDYDLSLGRIITSTLFALIIVSQALAKGRSILNLSNFGFGNRWGKMTYGIYLLHPITLKMVDLFCRTIHFDHQNNIYNSVIASAVIFVLTLTLSYVSYHYFEIRFLKLKSTFQIVRSNTDVS
ncbi:MAG: hypothetical protein CL840_20130 [Crocinitomicaceae bacterium]|nr:hypothetical protein [Crocinitomicaceae bacterium]|tara:strand:+ start:273 stop:1430 length:1158 start_codon:yes stop_codon:yes gene_type:complete